MFWGMYTLIEADELWVYNVLEYTLIEVDEPWAYNVWECTRIEADVTKIRTI